MVICDWKRGNIFTVDDTFCWVMSDENVIEKLEIQELFADWKIFIFQYCHVGRLSHEVGWKYKSVVRTLENKRRVKSILEVQKRDKLKVNNCFFCFLLFSFIYIFQWWSMVICDWSESFLACWQYLLRNFPAWTIFQLQRHQTLNLFCFFSENYQASRWKSFQSNCAIHSDYQQFWI